MLHSSACSAGTQSGALSSWPLQKIEIDALLTDQERPGEVLLPLPLDDVQAGVRLQEPVEAAELEQEQKIT